MNSLLETHSPEKGQDWSKNMSFQPAGSKKEIKGYCLNPTWIFFPEKILPRFPQRRKQKEDYAGQGYFIFKRQKTIHTDLNAKGKCVGLCNSKVEV